jgi:hypothetical protein
VISKHLGWSAVGMTGSNRILGGLALHGLAWLAIVSAWLGLAWVRGWGGWLSVGAGGGGGGGGVWVWWLWWLWLWCVVCGVWCVVCGVVVVVVVLLVVVVVVVVVVVWGERGLHGWVNLGGWVVVWGGKDELPMVCLCSASGLTLGPC